MNIEIYICIYIPKLQFESLGMHILYLQHVYICLYEFPLIISLMKQQIYHLYKIWWC